MPKLLKSFKKSATISTKKHQEPIQKPKKTTYRYKLQIAEEEEVLLIGEGNFSFSLALAQVHHRADFLTCTCYDSESVLLEKYPESSEILQELRDLEATILFEVDCRNLRRFKKRFSKIVFNFPHVGLGIKDQDQNVRENQKLIVDFLVESKSKLKSTSKGDPVDGEIMVTLKNGIPYDLWDIKALAKQAGLVLKRSFEFVPGDYPGYSHRRTIGYDQNLSNPDNQEILKNKSRSYIFGTPSDS